MVERLSAADVAFLHNESRTSPQHVGGLIVLGVPSREFDYERLIRLLEERISLAPRYRQKVRTVPGHLANPVWVEDPHFDITYHVRRSALPRPGTEAQLLEFAARILSRRLDRNRPLWEMYLVEGLDARTAIVTKTHAAMVGEPDGIDLAQVLLDAAPTPRRTVETIWMPGPEPTSVALVRDAVTQAARRPLRIPEAVVRVSAVAGGFAAGVAGGMASTATAMLRRPADSPLRIEPGEHRRLAIARTRLEDYRAVRAAFGGTVNDAVLASVSGALRGWLLSRDVPLRPASTVRALVPVSVSDGPDDHPTADTFAGHDGAVGRAAHPAGTARRVTTAVRPLLVDLPVGEPDPVLRLTQLRYAMQSHRTSGRAVDAQTLTELAGFAPPTLQALGARAANELTRRLFSLVISNVPGPQLPLYAAGARMVEMFPVQPLGHGHAASIALASYDGGVSYGLNGDYDAMRDLGLLAELIEESVGELVTAARPAPTRRRRTSIDNDRRDGSRQDRR